METIHDVHDLLKNKHLDINKISKLSDVKAKCIFKIYKNLLSSLENSEDFYGNIVEIPILNMAKTLEENGYLVTKRQRNLNELLE